MKRVLDSFLQDQFDGMELAPGLFYDWKNSLRFAISDSSIDHNKSQFFEHALKRAVSIFNQIFEDQDEILVVSDVYAETSNIFLQRRPLNIYRKYVKFRQVLYKLHHYLMPISLEEADEEQLSVKHRFILPCRKADLRYSQLLKAILYEDFIQPNTILKNHLEVGYDVYIINNSKKVIFHLYDDRGCDVLASDKIQLKALYDEFNPWILEYDREQMDRLFQTEI